MKKFMKVLFSLALVGGAIAGVFYFIKTVLMKDYLDDYDDDDFDNDLYDEGDEDDREYVTITPQSDNDSENDINNKE